MVFKLTGGSLGSPREGCVGPFRSIFVRFILWPSFYYLTKKKKIHGLKSCLKNFKVRGAWVSQSGKRLPLDFGPGHGIKPHVRLCAEWKVCFSPSQPLPLRYSHPSLTCMCTLSRKKQIFKKFFLSKKKFSHTLETY